MRVAIFKWNFHFKIMVMNKIVVGKEEALKKVFKGVSLDSLAVGERSMVTKNMSKATLLPLINIRMNNAAMSFPVSIV
jgi:hypothetical protein